jgi:uncharacterized protein
MGDRVNVREARPDDLAMIRAINEAGQPGVAPLTQQDAATIASGAASCWIAEGNDGVVGYLIAYGAGDAYDGEEFAWFQRQYPTSLYIDQVAVARGGRRGGVGSALYGIATETAVARGFDALTCEVNLEPPNPVSLRFHRHLGFQEVGTLHTADGRTVALLRLRVPCDAPPP